MMLRYFNNETWLQLCQEDVTETVEKILCHDEQEFKDQVTETLIKHYTNLKCFNQWNLTGVVNFAPNAVFSGSKAQVVHAIIKQRVQNMKSCLESYNFSDGEHYAGIVLDSRSGTQTPVHSDFFTQLDAGQQQKEAIQEYAAPVENLADEEPDFPLTMAQLAKKVAPYGQFRSKYDFGLYTIWRPRTKPSIELSVKAFTRHHINAIARALIMKKYGLEVSAYSVINAATNSFKTCYNTSEYRRVLKENYTDKRVLAASDFICKLYERIFYGLVDLDWKKFAESYNRKPWDIGTFYIYLTDCLHIKIPKIPRKRKSGKKQK